MSKSMKSKKTVEILLTILRVIFGVLFAMATMYLAIPLTIGIHHIGVLVSVAAAAVITIILAFPGAVWKLLKTIYKNKVLKIIFNCIFSVCAILLVGALIISGMMIGASFDTDKSADGATAIVLGAQVKGTRPSIMLRGRLDAAVDYLTENPNAMCIVSGGKGEDEQISEAECMFNYLVEKGIAENRIIMEDKATSTRENLSFSAKIMQENGMDMQAVVITDRFHQWRGRYFAKAAGIEEIYSHSCDSPRLFAVGYWVREIFAIARVIVLGY